MRSIGWLFDARGRVSRRGAALIGLGAFVAMLLATAAVDRAGWGSAVAMVHHGDPLRVLLGLVVVVWISCASAAVFAAMVRRLHDTGASGWRMLIALFPLIGALILFLDLLQDGQPGDNAFGPDPRERA